ncbi:hypothetical protein YPPY95_2266, partial [Yersinia pestis PY-95]
MRRRVLRTSRSVAG